jgi:hypothetical protein
LGDLLNRIKEAFFRIKEAYSFFRLFILFDEKMNAAYQIINLEFLPQSFHHDLYQDQDRKLEEISISSPFAITISCGTLVVLLFIFFSKYWLGMGAILAQNLFRT